MAITRAKLESLVEDLIQKETDKYISIVDSDLKSKESDLLEIKLAKYGGF